MRACAVALVFLLPALARGETGSGSAPAPKLSDSAAVPVATSPAALRKIAQGDELAAAGDHRGALFCYLDAVNLDPRSAEARLRLAAAYRRAGHLTEAVEQWELAVALDPENAEARRLLERGRAALSLASDAGSPAPGAPGPKVYKLRKEESEAAQAAPQPPAK